MKNEFSGKLRRFRANGGPAALVQRTLAANGITTAGLPGGIPTPKPASPIRFGAAPAGARATDPTDGMERRVTDTAHGGRDWLLARPAQPAARPAIVVMLHGCTQTAADFALGTGMNAAAGARGWHVVWPEQLAEANAMRCWNWFEPGHQSPGAGEPEILAGIVADARTLIGAPAADVFVAGLSAGGAMAAVLADTHPALVRAVGVHSGLPIGAATSMTGALAAMRGGAAASGQAAGVPVIVFHGSADKTVAPANGEALAAHIAGRTTRGSTGGRRWTLRAGPAGEFWQVEGLGHAWSGGRPGGSHVDPAGPDATAEMVRFFAARQG